MTDVVLCGLCGHEQRQEIAVICTKCGAALHGDLRAVRTYLGLLRDAAARLSRTAPAQRGNDDDVRRTLDHRHPLTAAASPSPVDFGAAEAAAQLRAVVERWAQHLRREHPGPQPLPQCGHGSCVAGELPACVAREAYLERYDLVHRDQLERADAARWLADRWRVIRTKPWAPACARDVERAIRRAEEHIDQPPEEHYAGHCDVPLEDPARPGETYACGWELYAKLGQDVVRCKGCGTQHSVAMRREQMLASLGNQLVTAADAARALSTPEHEITAAMVRGWKHRGGLEQAIEETPDGGQRPAYDDRGRPLYWLRDVQDADRRIRYGTTNSTGKAS